jgi:hypothetical protein
LYYRHGLTYDGMYSIYIYGVYIYRYRIYLLNLILTGGEAYHFIRNIIYIPGYRYIYKVNRCCWMLIGFKEFPAKCEFIDHEGKKNEILPVQKYKYSDWWYHQYFVHPFSKQTIICQQNTSSLIHTKTQTTWQIHSPTLTRRT